MEPDDGRVPGAGAHGQDSTDLDHSQTRELSETEISEQRRTFSALLADEPALKEGETWYLIHSRWYAAWENFVQIDGDRGRMGPHPGPINNAPLLDPQAPGSLLVYMRENMDFVIKHEAVWTKLVEIYGGGPAIPRRVVSTMWNGKSIEIHPLRLQILRSTDMATPHWALFSKCAKLKELRAEMCKRLGVLPENVRIWDYHNDSKLKILEEPLNTLAEERILDGQKLLFEERQADGKWAKLTAQRDLETTRYSGERVSPGQCGLNNLGNTCFMNSGLQCLSNTVPLARFMITGEYEREINRDNPLGTGGELVSEFADLLQDIWSGRLTSVGPRDFKWKLERFAPQFSGWQQHDSQELLAFLLDGMHEDLNRVKKKPFFETNEFEHLPEGEAADKSWAQHMARNNSFITDWCHGLLRSEVKCNVCPRVSKVFDPFMYMTVPLPESKTRFLELLYWTQDLSVPPVRYGFMAPKHGTIYDFMVMVAQRTGFSSPERLQLCDVYSQRFFKVYKGDEKMSTITDRDVLYVFECYDSAESPPAVRADAAGPAAAMQEVAVPPGDSLVNVVVLFKEERVYSSTYYNSASTSLSGLDPPLIVAVPRAVPYGQLYAFLRQRLARFFKPSAVAASNAAVAAARGEPAEGAPPADEPASDTPTKPLFQIYRGGRQAAFRPETIPDDEIVALAESESICIALDTESTQRGVFNVDEGRRVTVDASASENANTGEGQLTLDQCITLFGEEEQLSEDDPWYCSTCKEHRRAFKKFAFWKLPKVLIIHLKRFSYKSKHWREKIESLVQFPLEGLDLRHHIKGPLTAGEDPIYDLYAISNHYGALGGGHYTAFAKNVNDGQWYKYDDSSVSLVRDPAHVVTTAAYVLFYQRRDTRPAPGFVMPLPARALGGAGEASGSSARAVSPDVVDQDPRNVLSFSVQSTATNDSTNDADSSDDMEDSD